MRKSTTVNEVRDPNFYKFVSYDDLKEYGIPYTDVHILRLRKAGKFPKPVRLSENRIAWRLSDLIEWIESRPEAA
jgi:prophage regulatory protein